MKEKLVPYLGNYYLRKPRSVVIMDNATFHAGVKELTEGTGAKLIYLSAYSPELNPIELNSMTSLPSIGFSKELLIEHSGTSPW